MDIPFSIEIIVTIALFIVAGVGAVLSWILLDIREDIKKIWGTVGEYREKISGTELKVNTLETRIDLCKKCPAGNGHKI